MEFKKGFFHFKHFEVEQTRSAMKVGTDGVLLGAWVGLNGHEKHILDIGTGTGVIALMLGQRTAGYGEEARIDAVEVEEDACAEAAGNFQRSPWSGRLQAVHMPVQTYADASEEKYDLIVSNPPYFMAGLDFRRGRGWDTSPGATVPTRERIAARHAEMLPYEALIEAVVKLLEPDSGRFAAIFPYQEFAVFTAKAAVAGLYCYRQLEIRGAEKKGIKRVAAEFSFRKPTGGKEIRRESLCIENGGGTDYSEAYRQLTGEFYLKF